MSKTADFNTRNIFFTSFMAIVEGWCNSHQSEFQSIQMERLLTSWNVEIPGDGNCLFTSVAFSLVQRIQGGDQSTRERLHALGVHEVHIQDINYIRDLLRVRMVEEWNANHDDYQGFISTDITTLTHEYLQSDQFSGSLGDLMVQTLANILQIPITIVTSVTDMPLLCIMPTTELTGTVQPIFLAYTQSGPGHYDCAVPLPTEETPSAQTKPTKCTCGRKPGYTGAACSSLRCACTRAKQECSVFCTCKGCRNTYGVRPPPSSTRRRQSYDNQRKGNRLIHSCKKEGN